MQLSRYFSINIISVNIKLTKERSFSSLNQDIYCFVCPIFFSVRGFMRTDLFHGNVLVFFFPRRVKNGWWIWDKTSWKTHLRKSLNHLVALSPFQEASWCHSWCMCPPLPLLKGAHVYLLGMFLHDWLAAPILAPFAEVVWVRNPASWVILVLTGKLHKPLGIYHEILLKN